ncbi:MULTISPECIES: Tn3 family transposase [unclassified Nonomuraea]|uniref:Tn3 family transposase n=1 Tax=unclassified Nonomuraea TaxID=2593643 RepID=UPI0033FF2BB4
MASSAGVEPRRVDWPAPFRSSRAAPSAVLSAGVRGPEGAADPTAPAPPPVSIIRACPSPGNSAQRCNWPSQRPGSDTIEELGKAVKSIFVAEYVASQELRREIHEGLQVVENWNSANTDLFRCSPRWCFPRCPAIPRTRRTGRPLITRVRASSRPHMKRM